MNSYLKAITALGSGSLHPGGFTGTLGILRNFTIAPDEIILDLGCGTGRTACHLAKTYGAHVFALDNSEAMLSKAKSRALQEGVEVHYVLGDILDLPFKDNIADLVIVESVLIFLPVRPALQECFRVLKKKGYLVCVEMFASGSLPANEREKLKALCGLKQIPTYQEWLNYFQTTGFTFIKTWQKKLPGPLEVLKELLNPDPCWFRPGEQVYLDPASLSVLFKYKRLMMRNKRHLGYGTFILIKE
ncbi:MAG TPA: class I SAM-dependent methyltransferase [Firmicutes bacterium]|jgi:ubiquinone/menaquinone biosynthesis C-methylase UbiE|nr:class I SAM-dependent methyltransferase [Peptococcaceae bacterium MAG4]NLW39267.1 class I SAM-dependent methyltransferase [Peptococcaceae bacterium]HAA33799.1 class I SAM-dependent methyltransferase [Bacillota bacterium]HPZ42868.1 class I SAM-dependent methyltransferase [Bacillota bacterium]